MKIKHLVYLLLITIVCISPWAIDEKELTLLGFICIIADSIMGIALLGLLIEYVIKNWNEKFF